MLGVGVGPVGAAHLFGVIHHHLVVQLLDPLGAVDVVQLLDIEIAEAERLFQLHPVLPAHPGDHGGGHHKVVFQIDDGVPREHAHAGGVGEAVQLAVSAHCIGVAVGHGAVEQNLLAGLAVLHLVHVVIGLDQEPFVFVSHVASLPQNGFLPPLIIA